MLTLYHCNDSRSFRALWALEELGLAYELKPLRFPPRLHNPEFLDLHPMGTVPLLIDGSSRLFESAAILEYLGNHDGGSPLALKPGEADYADWLSWIHYGESMLTAPQAAILRYSLFLPEEKRSPAVAEDCRDLYLERLPFVEQALADREYLCAGRFTVADISVGYALLLNRPLKLMDRWSPGIAAYWERLSRRPGFLAAKAAQTEGRPRT